MESLSRKKILIYDGSCATCRVMKGAAEKAVANYEFIDAESPAGRELVAERALNIDSSAYLIDGERTLARSDMVLEVVRDFLLIGPALAFLTRAIPYRGRDALYRWLVRHRIK